MALPRRAKLVMEQSTKTLALVGALGLPHIRPGQTQTDLGLTPRYAAAGILPCPVDAS